MGHTTKISDYELDRGDGPEPCEGVDIEVKAKTVEPEDKPEPKKSAAKTK
jgi:hypothetical protein